VRIVSSRLFEQLPARFRDGLRLDREVHQAWSREQMVNELIARLPEAIGATQVDSCNVLATGIDPASPLARSLVEIVTVLKTVDLGAILQGRAPAPPASTAEE
jgi:hypothetical protein